MESKKQFHWLIWIGVPLALAVILFILDGIEPSFQFKDLMEKLGVINQSRFVRMACLVVVCVVILVIVKTIGEDQEQE